MNSPRVRAAIERARRTLLELPIEQLKHELAVLEQMMINLEPIAGARPPSEWNPEWDYPTSRMTKKIVGRVEALTEDHPTCTWTESDPWGLDEDCWITDCEHDFIINSGSPSENDMQYCCYCGARLVEVPYVEEVEDE